LKKVKKMKKIFIFTLLFAGMTILYGQAPDFSDSVCLVEALDEMARIFREIPEEEIPPEFRFDSIRAEGDCDSADIYANIGPIPLKMMTALRVDSCNLKMDYNDILEGIDTLGLNDTTVNVCELEQVNLTTNSTELLQLSAVRHSIQGNVLFTYSVTSLNRREPAVLQLFKSSGQEILSISFSNHDKTGSGTYVWDKRDADGKEMASGTYFAALKCTGKARVIKISLNR
jgi:hypothetical protein